MARKKKSTSDQDPRWTSDLKPAPGDLRVVQAFLNTADPSQERTSSRALADCLELWGLVPPGTELSESDLRKAIEVRDALRAVIASQHAKTVDEAAVVRLDRAMAHATVRVRYGTGGWVRFEPAAEGIDAALACLTAIVAAAQLEGSWTRMKICAGKKCRAAYFDFSKNRSATWCSAKCGSRSSSLRYRHRNLERIRKTDRGYSFVRRFTRHPPEPFR